MTAQGYHGASIWPAAKIRPPRTRIITSRPRLLDPLHGAARKGHVALIVAPGGTGKTTLLADWARHTAHPVAWYAVDRVDRDPHRLADGLCAAVAEVLPDAAGPARAALASGAQEAAAIGLLLGAIEGQSFALVIDDFHHLDDAPDCLALWDHLLRFRPPELALIVLSRTVPALGFTALAAFDQLTGLGAADLRFDADEARALLDVHGLDARHAAEFVRRGGGWAAGVLLQARTAPDGPWILRARTEVLMEHLGAEILGTLPLNLRDFLLVSACLGPARAQDADAILLINGSGIHYAELVARGLFLDQDGAVYRYHDLFADYLTDLLKREDPERLRAVRRATADYWAAHDDLPRALSVLAADEDWEAIAAILDRERTTLWTRGLGGMVLMHVDRLPQEYRTPRLLALCGHVRSQRGEHAEALTLADAAMAAAVDDEEWLSAALLRVQALAYAERDDDADRSATAALDVALRVNHGRAVIHLRELRGAVRLRLGRLVEGESDLKIALSAHRHAGDEEGEARTLYNLSTELITAGHAGGTEAYLTHADALWQRLGNGAVTGFVLHSKALLSSLLGNYEGAIQDADAARVAAHENGYPLVECEATAVLAHALTHAGKIADAERVATAAIALATRLDLGGVLNNAWRARISVALLRRDRATARQWIDEARSFAVRPVDVALLDVLDGMLALRSNAHRRAVDVLGRAAECLERVNRPHQAAQAYLLRAESYLALDRIRRAEESLNRMAHLVLPLGSEGYLHPMTRVTHRVATHRRLLRHLHREARLLLDRLMDVTPRLSLMPTRDEVLPPRALLLLSPFGQGYIALGGHAIPLSALPAKARELLFFAGQAGGPLSRDEILDALWDGDMGCASAFWNATRHLRRVLGDDGWGRHDGAYSLSRDVVREEQRFDAAAARAWAAAPAPDRIAAGEEALSIVGAGGYLEWCDSLWVMTARNRTTRQAIRVALALADLYGKAGQDDDAISACRRAILFDTLDEAPRRALLHHLHRMGKEHAIRREYAAYRRLVRVELASEPSPELQTFAAALS